MILGIGTDIVEVARIEQALERLGRRFARRILSDQELEEFDDHRMPERFLAKRFAVKEAAAKALGTGIAQGVSWQHIAVSHNELGAPLLLFSERAQQLQKEKGITSLHVSLSDEQNHVVAFVILESRGKISG